MIVYDTQYEQLAIGLMVNNQDAAYYGLANLETDCFFDPNFKIAFLAIENISKKQKKIDIYSVNEEIKTLGKVFSLDELLSIEDKFYLQEKFDTIIDTLKDKKKKRFAIHALKVIENDLQTSTKDYEDLIKGVGDLYQISKEKSENSLSRHNYIELREKHDQDKMTKTPLFTGYYSLDSRLTYKINTKEISVIGARPSNGKCLGQNTLINTNSGLKYIKDIREGELVYSLTPENKIILNSVKKKSSSGIKQLYEVKLMGLGYTIEASENHKFLTQDGWKELKNLTSSDSLAIPSTTLNIQDKTSEYSNNFCRLVGYLLGDGSFKESPRFVTQNPRLIEDIQNILDDLYNGEVILKEKSDHGNGVKSFSFSKNYKNCHEKNKLSKDLHKLGLIGKFGENKYIPNELLNSKENIKNIIIGLWETDGSSTEFSNISKDIVIKLQQLLLYFGVLTSRNERYSICREKRGKLSYRIQLYDKESIRKFWKSIGQYMSESKKKNDLFIRFNKTYKDKSNFRNFPPEVWTKIQNYISIKELFKGLGRNSSGNRSRTLKQGISISYLKRIIETIQKKKNIIPYNLLTLINREILFLKINSIKPTREEETFDLEINENHNFVANGIIVHNSAFKANLIRNFCTQGLGVVSYALEQSIEIESDRLEAIVSGVHIQDIADMRFWKPNDERKAKLKKAREDIASWNYFLFSGFNKTLAEFKGELRFLKSEGIKIVFWDLFDRMKEISRSAANKAQTVTNILNQSLALANELDMHFCLLVQNSRDTVKRKKSIKPTISELKDSGGYEEVARIIFLLHYQKHYEPTLMTSELEVNVAKQSNGATFTHRFLLDTDTLKISDTDSLPRGLKGI